jgi:hypothetical protein
LPKSLMQGQKVLSEPVYCDANKFSLNCLTFTGTLNQSHFTLLFISTSFRTISYFSFFITLFLWSMLACWLERARTIVELEESFHEPRCDFDLIRLLRALKSLLTTEVSTQSKYQVHTKLPSILSAIMKVHLLCIKYLSARCLYLTSFISCIPDNATRSRHWYFSY